MARSFNGSTDKIVAGFSPSYAAVSVSLWFAATGTQTNPRIFSDSHTDADNNGFQFYAGGSLLGTPNMFFNVGNGTTNATANNNSAITFVSGIWYHGAGTYDGTTIKIYINGSVGANTAALTGSMTAGTANITIGLFTGGGSGLIGNIADVAIWNTALTAGNITSLFNGVRPVNVNSANLTGWWPLDGFASPETDASSGGNNGTVTGTGQVIGPPALWRISG